MWVQARANMTYATSKLRINEEPNYPDNLKYLSKVGLVPQPGVWPGS